MDRRQALKKLGAGGAVVASAPILLDSFNVAHASSTQLPSSEEVRTSTSVSVDVATGAVTLTLDVGGSSPVIFPANSTFSWGSPTPNNIKIQGASNASSVTVDESGNSTAALPQFTIVLTATGGTPSATRSYTITYLPGPPPAITVA